MFAYGLRRLLLLIPVAIIVSMIVFSFIHVGGTDPALYALGDEAEESVLEAFREEYGLNDSLPVQYLKWLGRVVRGDLGITISSPRVETIGLIKQRLPVTLELGALSMAISLAMGLPLGMLAGRFPGSKLDAFVTSVSALGVAVPGFLFGLMLILIFSLWIRLLPPSGYVPFSEDPIQNLKLMIMPASTIGIELSAFVMRITRTAMVEIYSQDYIRTARAKGLNERTVMIRHTARNAMLPVITVIGLQLGVVFGGSVITETLFAIPGLGKLTVDAVFLKDFILVQGVVLVFSGMFMGATLIVDMLYSFIDPRIRFGSD